MGQFVVWKKPATEAEVEHSFNLMGNKRERPRRKYIMECNQYGFTFSTDKGDDEVPLCFECLSMLLSNEAMKLYQAY